MKKVVISLMLFSASITPAFANYFSNPEAGINLNIGSAPNPTPQQLREDTQPMIADVQNPAPKPESQVTAKQTDSSVQDESQSTNTAVLATPADPKR